MLAHFAWVVLVTAVFVFISSSLIHMVFKWHNSDYGKLANEDTVRDVLRAGSPKPGQYVIPHCLDMKQMSSPEMQAKWIEGPVAFVQVKASGLPKMGPQLGQWFLLNVGVAAFVALALVSIPAASLNAHVVFHIAALVTLLSYGVGSISGGIWYAQTWSSVAKDLLDALIYALVSGAVFAWLWPAS
jgi:hypothetical protein